MKIIILLLCCVLLSSCAKLLEDAYGVPASRTAGNAGELIKKICLRNYPKNQCTKMRYCVGHSFVDSYENHYIFHSGSDAREYIIKTVREQSHNNLDALIKYLDSIDSEARIYPIYKFSTRDMKYEIASFKKIVNKCRP